MATMLAFVATDAKVAQPVLEAVLKQAVDISFNRITVDGDTSTNDACTLSATGEAEMAEIDRLDSAAGQAFAAAITRVMCDLAQMIVRDGEGATKFVTLQVEGAASQEDALKVAFTIAHSPLVKTALFASDPNWGRIFMAVGKSQIPLDESKIDVYVNDIQIVVGGRAIAYNVQSVVMALGDAEVRLRVGLNVGDGYGQAWGCDLTEEYVVFNSAYTT
jgi:glutamate N-acetyltransferase/amino-acid N-acetyltransferase